MKNKILLTVTILSVFAISACSAEVGSKEWCDQIKEKPKGELTSNEAAEFAKSCIFK